MAKMELPRRAVTVATTAIMRLRFAATRRVRRPGVVLYFAWPDFERKARALASLLQNQGIPATVQSGLSPFRRAVLCSSPDLFIGYWNKVPLDVLPKNFIFLNAEPLTIQDPHRDDAGWYRIMQSALEVWDYADMNSKILASLGVPFSLVPFGYAPYFEQCYEENTRGKGLREDIDVLFVGGLTARRQALIERLQSIGLAVCTVTRKNPLHGAALDEVIARSRIFLHIHRFSDTVTHVTDLARLDNVLSNRRFVIHESLLEDAADPGFTSNVVTSRFDEIPEMCIHYLRNPQERLIWADKSYKWFKASRDIGSTIPYDRVRAHLAALGAT